LELWQKKNLFLK